MFTHIKINEVRIFARQMADGMTTEEGDIIAPISSDQMLEELELIDNMLTVMKSTSLMNKKRNVKKMMDGLLALAVNDGTVVPGASNNHLLE